MPWFKEWPKSNRDPDLVGTMSTPIAKVEYDRVFGVDMGMSDRTVTALVKDGEIIDWIDNLIFVCAGDDVYGCGAVLNPHTPSFQKLVDVSKAEGWTMKWLDEGYDTHCPGCKK